VNVKYFLVSVLAGLQVPVAYYLAGHSLFVREPGLGYVYLITLYIGVLTYFFIRTYPK
jgi:hypothetical protein